MATVTVTSGPRKLLKTYEILPDREKMQELFEKLLLECCFWQIDYAGLDQKMSRELKIIDYACRSARAIFLKKTKIYIDEILVSVNREDKMLFNETIRMIINLLEVSSGELKIEKDTIFELRFRTSPNLETLDFLEQYTFARA